MTLDDLRGIIRQALHPGCFYVAAGCALRVEHRPFERSHWEIFLGHLLDASQTREQKDFEAWIVWLRLQGGAAEEPILSVKLDAAGQRIHVVRHILVHAWEAYEAENKVIRSRPAQKHVPELIGTIRVAATRGLAALAKELAHYVFLAIVGTSRLPITSLESPLSAYSLGWIGYVPPAGVAEAPFAPGTPPPKPAPLVGPQALMEDGLTSALPQLQTAKLVEAVLRTVTPDEVSEAAERFARQWQRIGRPVSAIAPLVKTLFNHVALSPYTAFADNLVAFLAHLAGPEWLGPGAVIDLIGYLMRHLARHLTAFDLVTFHNFGANYPDALLLDALLRAYLRMIERHPHEFNEPPQPADDSNRQRCSRLRRRALRQAWLLRKHYEGLPVPDAPTSPGENLRVLPEPFARVPDEQILERNKRRKRLFADCPAEALLADASRRLLRQSVQDLESPAELRELGMAVYLDRPLGIFKEPGEADRTPLLSYEAFSLTVAERRLEQLRSWEYLASKAQYDALLARLRAAAPTAGVRVAELHGPERPGVVALEDARKAASDFRFLRTTRSSLRLFLSPYDWEPLHRRMPAAHDWLHSGESVLLIRCPRPFPASGRQESALYRSDPMPLLVGFDDRVQPRLELGLGQLGEGPIRYVESMGIEYLEGGLRLLRTWELNGTGGCEVHDFTGESVLLPPTLPAAPP